MNVIDSAGIQTRLCDSSVQATIHYSIMPLIIPVVKKRKKRAPMLHSYQLTRRLLSTGEKKSSIFDASQLSCERKVWRSIEKFLHGHIHSVIIATISTIDFYMYVNGMAASSTVPFEKHFWNIKTAYYFKLLTS